MNASNDRFAKEERIAPFYGPIWHRSNKNGMINRHKCVYWCTENPNITLEEELNPPGVWVGENPC